MYKLACWIIEYLVVQYDAHAVTVPWRIEAMEWIAAMLASLSLAIPRPIIGPWRTANIWYSSSSLAKSDTEEGWMTTARSIRPP